MERVGRPFHSPGPRRSHTSPCSWMNARRDLVHHGFSCITPRSTSSVSTSVIHAVEEPLPTHVIAGEAAEGAVVEQEVPLVASPAGDVPPLAGNTPRPRARHHEGRSGTARDVRRTLVVDHERPAHVTRGTAPALVVACAGPWRVSGEWWDIAGWARDEWDLLLDDGTLCRLARDHVSGQWLLDGVYD